MVQSRRYITVLHQHALCGPNWLEPRALSLRAAGATDDGERGEKEFWCGPLIASRTREMRHLILNLRRVCDRIKIQNIYNIYARALARTGNVTPLVSGHFDGARQKLVLKGADRRD